MENIPTQTGRPRHARRLFIIIVILAGFGLVGGVINFSTAIRQPLSFTSSNPYIKNQLTNGLVTTTVQDQQRIDALKTRDSDGDGLNDYDELYVYHTSPYLKDSDSDGTSDYDEVKNGTDPNCPQGKACTPIALNTNESTTTNGSATNTTKTNTTAASSSPQALLDTNALRQALLDAGAPQDQLNNLSDSDLITLYSQVLTSPDTNTSLTNSASNTNGNSNTTTTTVSSVTYQELQNMTAAEIRQLLVQGGADATSLQQLDDASLKSIFLQSISNLKVTQ